MRFTPQLLPSRSGHLGVLLLNNPAALNALSLEMMHCMRDVLDEWFASNGNSDRPKAILLKASHENAKVPAFCAGGDVKRVYQSALEDAEKQGQVGQGRAGLDSAEFFRQEYYNNHTLGTASTSSLADAAAASAAASNNSSDDPTVVSFMDGLVFGGGVGISIYGRYRVATERTVWAMPETGIGLFPDVGSLYWMPRLLQKHRGMAVYLALTGRRLVAADLLYAGLATHYVPSDQLPALEDAMVQALEEDTSQGDPLAPVLMSFHQETQPAPRDSPLARDGQSIEKIFGGVLGQPKPLCTRLEDIMAALEQDDNFSSTEFAQQTAVTLHKMSPTSLKLTLEGLRRGAAAQSMAENLRMEFRLAQACLRPRRVVLSDDDDGTTTTTTIMLPDFYEGIRAALIDKDQNPAWSPATLEDVSDEWIASFFDEPIEEEWEAPATSSDDSSTNSKL